MTVPASPSNRCHTLALRTPLPDVEFLILDTSET
jgi:hypothetical protein